MINRRHFNTTVLAGLAAPLAVHRAAQAQATTFPERPITWVMPYPTGGFGDSFSRLLTQKMSEKLGQTIIVDNRSGAAGQIGAAYVKQQPADGYTVLYGDIGIFSINPGLYPKLPYDMQRDFVPVTRLFTTPLVVVVPPNSRFNTLADLIAATKAEPGVNFGSYGIGSGSHLWSETFKRHINGKMTHIPYKGAGPALQDLMGGRLDMLCDVSASAVPLVRDGKIKALAVVGSDKRLKPLPNVPTLAELGLSPIDHPGWNGVVLRTGTPPAVAARLHAEIVAAMNHPDIVNRYAELGLTVATQSPAQFGEFIRSETARWGAVIKEANITLE